MLGEGLDKGAPALQGLQLERLGIAAPHRAGEQHNDGRQVMPHILACSIRQCSTFVTVLVFLV